MTTRTLCACGACCDYHDGTPCVGHVDCLNPDAVCPAHACQNPKHREDPNAQARLAEQRQLEANATPTSAGDR